jgi:hypothetical protein
MSLVCLVSNNSAVTDGLDVVEDVDRSIIDNNDT